MRRLTTVGGDGSPSWSPGASRVAFSRASDDECERPRLDCSQIWIVDRNGASPHPVTPRSVRAEAPDWSPSGDLIAYVEWDDRPGGPEIKTDIYAALPDGTGRRRLTTARAADDDPEWSPDGRQIVFSSERHGNWELYVMEADGARQRRLTRTSKADEYAPSWSPDGRRIAFWRRSTERESVVVMSLGGSRERTLTGRGKAALRPRWSPDGARIAYLRQTDSLALQEIWVMSATGTNKRRLVRGPYTQPEGLDWASGSG
jgi:Tol biopolymer transport system component